MAIDIGSGASDMASSIASEGNTVIDLNNPCNANGTIDTVEMWFAAADADGSGVKVGIFYATTGNYYKCRSAASITGDVTKGSKQSKAATLTAYSGDYIGWHCDDGQMERATSGGAGIVWVAGDQVTVGTEVEYALLADDMAAIYATGSSTPPGWASITSIMGKASGNISHIMGKPVANISHINGKAV